MGFRGNCRSNDFQATFDLKKEALLPRGGAGRGPLGCGCCWGRIQIPARFAYLQAQVGWLQVLTDSFLSNGPGSCALSTLSLRTPFTSPSLPGRGIRRLSTP